MINLKEINHKCLENIPNIKKAMASQSSFDFYVGETDFHSQKIELYTKKVIVDQREIKNKLKKIQDLLEKVEKSLQMIQQYLNKLQYPFLIHSDLSIQFKNQILERKQLYIKKACIITSIHKLQEQKYEVQYQINTNSIEIQKMNSKIQKMNLKIQKMEEEYLKIIHLISEHKNNT